jgi:hypothetical protein
VEWHFFAWQEKSQTLEKALQEHFKREREREVALTEANKEVAMLQTQAKYLQVA